ncbi:MAG: hypothetical protein KIT57_17045 [Blastocatellales bacterium]|nr:hypothetical protein [Blastocatellales bacterium]
MPPVVVDTNVPMVANEQASQAGHQCVSACIAELEQIVAGRQILLDDRGLIIEEYRRRLSLSGQPGVGDMFFKWLWNNQANPRHCRQVTITPTDDDNRGFVEFPKDPELANFDPNDRKFVATALASGVAAPILNASDTDWWVVREALERHGVKIHFICPELMSTEK